MGHSWNECKSFFRVDQGQVSGYEAVSTRMFSYSLSKNSGKDSLV